MRYTQLEVSSISRVFIYERLFTWTFVCCCNLMTFCDERKCVVTVPGTTKHSSCNCNDTWQ